MDVGITGHRPHKLGSEYNLVGPYSDAITNALEGQISLLQPTTYVSGMALGVDQIWALLAIKHGANLTAVIPFKGQENMWPQASKDLYYKILAYPKCTKVYVSEPPFSSYKMQLRNEYIVNHIHHLIGIWDGSSGGTANCVRYAEKQKREMTIINPQKLF